MYVGVGIGYWVVGATQWDYVHSTHSLSKKVCGLCTSTGFISFVEKGENTYFAMLTFLAILCSPAFRFQILSFQIFVVGFHCFLEVTSKQLLISI